MCKQYLYSKLYQIKKKFTLKPSFYSNIYSNLIKQLKTDAQQPHHAALLILSKILTTSIFTKLSNQTPKSPIYSDPRRTFPISFPILLLLCNDTFGETCRTLESSYSRIDQAKFFKICLPQILQRPFFKNLDPLVNQFW